MSVPRDWIESLLASIQEAVKGWPVLPGEPFQKSVLVDGDLYFITLDTIDGVTVAWVTASKDAQKRLFRDVIKIGDVHLAKGLAMLHRAVVS